MMLHIYGGLKVGATTIEEMTEELLGALRVGYEAHAAGATMEDACKQLREAITLAVRDTIIEEGGGKMPARAT